MNACMQEKHAVQRGYSEDDKKKQQQPLKVESRDEAPLAGRQRAGGGGQPLVHAASFCCNKGIKKSLIKLFWARWSVWWGAEGVEGVHVKAASRSVPEHLCVPAANKGVITTTCLLMDPRDASSDTDGDHCSRAAGTEILKMHFLLSVALCWL